MKLAHVTKDSKCCHCGAGVIECKELTCHEHFSPTRKGHVFHLKKCAQKYRRRGKNRDLEKETPL